MRIRLLSGNQAGQIVDMPGAALLISNGLAEAVPDEAPPLETAIVTAAEPAPVDANAGASLTDEDLDMPSEEPPADRVPGRLRTPRPRKLVPAVHRRKRR